MASQDSMQHCVIFSELPDDTDAVIDDQTANYRRLGKPFEWKVYRHDRPVDLREQLAAGVARAPGRFCSMSRF
jgi:hypothetical protein